MAFPCALKLLFGQLILALVAACALLGIKLTYGPIDPFQDDDKEIKAHLQGFQGLENPTVDSRSRGVIVQSQTESSDITPVVASTAAVAPDDVPYQHKHSVYRRAHKYGDLPALRWDMSPESETWSNSIAICACMYGENTTDVREWILYNRWLGVDHIYLTENGPPPPESVVTELQEFIDDGFITFKADPRPAFQQTIYIDCMTQHRHKHNWMAFIDLDEFIVLRDKDTTLKEFLDGYKHHPALVMHWVIVGPSHQKSRPQEGGVLRAYRECQLDPSPVVKSITNTFMLANMASNPHTFEYRDNNQSVDELYRPMPWRYPLPQSCTDGSIRNPQDTLDCRPLPHVQKWPSTAQHIALFHYITRSEEDFERKAERGGGGGKHRTWDHFNRIQQDASGTGGLCDAAFNVADLCCKLDDYTTRPLAPPPPAPPPPPSTSKEKSKGKKSHHRKGASL